jgi:hypothetical protein
MADLSSVGIILDHIACTSGPLLFPRYGITLIIAVGGAFCPLNAEFHLRHSLRLRTRFPQPIGRLPHRPQTPGADVSHSPSLTVCCA